LILVIGNEGCTNCERTKQILDEKGIKYEYKYLSELENKKYYIQTAREQGQLAMPLIFTNNKLVTLDEVIDSNTLKITKRSNDVSNFDKQRIINAINNAMFETGDIDNNLSEMIAYEIETEIPSFTKVEDIQDLVINKLKKYNRDDIAKRYSKYRNKKTKEREIKHNIIVSTFILCYF
jgi:glutaredoxin